MAEHLIVCASAGAPLWYVTIVEHNPNHRFDFYVQGTAKDIVNEAMEHLSLHWTAPTLTHDQVRHVTVVTQESCDRVIGMTIQSVDPNGRISSFTITASR